MNQTLFTSLPDDIERHIFNMLDHNINSLEEYEKKYWKIRFTNSMIYLDKEKLTKYILSHLVDTYLASYRYSHGDYKSLASFGLALDDDGNFVKGDGRYRMYDDKGNKVKGIKFLTNDKVIPYMRFDDKYNFKQKRTIWLLMKFYDLEIQNQ